MANNKSQTAKAGLTPVKAALIGVLAVILAVVLYVQFGSSGDDAEPSVVSASAEAAPAVDQPRVRRGKGEPKAREVVTATIETMHKKADNLSHWQPPKLAGVIQYDPFALPASFPQPRTAAADEALAQAAVDADSVAEADPAKREAELTELRTKLNELRHNGVQVIIRQQDQYVAMIGDQTIHVGDEIGGFKVIAIDGNGVHVARDLTQ